MKLIMISAYMEQMGNVLLRHFDSHPDLFVSPFESQLGTKYSQNVLSPEVHFRYSWPEFPVGTTVEEAYQLMYDEETKTYLRTPNRSKFKDCGMLLKESNRILAFNEFCESQYLHSRKMAIEAYFYSTFCAWENCCNKGSASRYVGYNPQMILDTDKMISDFPDIKIIHIVRNSFSGFADTMKRPFHLPLTQYCKLWNICQLYALTYSRKYPNNFYIVRAEDLIEYKAEVMKDLLKKVDLPWSDNVLYPSFNGKDLSDSVYPWGTVKQATTKANIETGNELNQTQKDQIRMECFAMLEQFDYSNYFKKS